MLLIKWLVTDRGLAFVAAIEARQPKLAQKFNSSTTVEPMFVSRHNAKPMLAAALFVRLFVIVQLTSFLLMVKVDKLCHQND